MSRAWAWPVGIGLGLGFVVVANAVMISIAISNPSAPAADDHWRAAQGWDAQLELREHSAKLGWSVASVARGGSASELIVQLVDPHDQPLEGLNGVASLQRSDTTQLDTRAPLSELGDGRYLVHLDAPARGQLQLSLELLDSDGQPLVLHQTLELGP